MRWRFNKVCIKLSVFLIWGCVGPESLVLSSDVSSAPADGQSVYTAKAAVEFRGDPLPDRERVEFSSTTLRLFESREDAEDLDDPGESNISVQTIGGAALVYLRAPSVGGAAVLLAQYSTSNATVLDDSLSLDFAAPPAIDGSASGFSFRCGNAAQPNIGAFVEGRSDIELPCAATLLDLSGTAQPLHPLRFYAEAGTLKTTIVDGLPVYSYVVSASPTVRPVETEPSNLEEDAGLVAFDGERSLNPRDGVVTLLIVARGSEAFEDLNDNGIYDAGEPFEDLGEPFLDVDDDGVYDAFVDPPPCCDDNQNGRVDGPNGRYDAAISIGRVQKIMWSGAPDLLRSGLTPALGTLSIPAGGTLSGLQFRIVDINFNPIASHDDGDRFELDAGSKVLLSPNIAIGDSLALSAATGLSFDSAGVLSSVEQSPLWIRDFGFSLFDDRNSGASSFCQELSFQLEASIEYTIAPKGPSGNFSSATQDLVIPGVLMAADPCP